MNACTVSIWARNFTGLHYKDWMPNIFPGEMIYGALMYSIQFWLPFIVVNYFLILFRNRYIYLMKKYVHYKRKYFLNYCISSIGILFITVIIDAIIR